MAISIYKKTPLIAGAILAGLVATASASAAIVLKSAAKPTEVHTIGRFEVTPEGARFIEADSQNVVTVKK